MKSTSPFADYKRAPLNPAPMGLTPEEYLGIWIEGATPQEWMNLARSFLTQMDEPLAE